MRIVVRSVLFLIFMKLHQIFLHFGEMLGVSLLSIYRLNYIEDVTSFISVDSMSIV